MSYKFRVMSYLSDIKKSLAAAFLLLCGLAACSDEADMPVPGEGESIKVPISFNLLDVGSLTTRVSPDDNLSYGGNVRPNTVNAVNVYVYSRDADGSYRDYADGFTLGYTYTLPVQDLDEEAWPRYVASGEIEMSSSKEYRINAVAYTKEESGEASFKLNGSLFRQAEIELNQPSEQANTLNHYNPELFFGTVLFEDTDSIFTYERTKNNKAGLSGWLYRGVAGIELFLYNIPDNVKDIKLVASEINTKVHARWYDDFVSSYEKIGQELIDGDSPVLGHGIIEKDVDSKYENKNICRIVGPNILTKICTMLGVVIATETSPGDDTENIEYSYARLRLKETSSVPGVPYYPEDNEDITTRTVPDDDGLGTGIIPDNDLPTDPEHPEEDDPLAPFRVCFMRNNYYKIEGDFERLNQQKYTLRVIVNPNWDQKVSLTLEEASGDSNNGGNTN